MKSKITIEIDIENKTITNLIVPKEFNPIDVTRILLSIVLQELSRVQPIKQNKIEVVQPKIIKGA
jgi:hypothetical protein